MAEIKIKKDFVFFFIILIIVLILAFVLARGDEDTWICVDGEWVKHGVPSAPKPTKPCAGEDIYVSSPKPNQVINSPLVIEGKARGTWFFEADFPIELIDEQWNLLATGIARANPPAGGEWMTEDFVSFEGQIEFDITQEINGTLILKKDNPSGLPEHDDELRMPLRLTPN